MRQIEDIGDAVEQVSKLRTALLLILDAVDYTNHACEITEMVGACLDRKIITQARNTLKETD